MEKLFTSTMIKLIINKNIIYFLLFVKSLKKLLGEIIICLNIPQNTLISFQTRVCVCFRIFLYFCMTYLFSNGNLSFFHRLLGSDLRSCNTSCSHPTNSSGSAPGKAGSISFLIWAPSDSNIKAKGIEYEISSGFQSIAHVSVVVETCFSVIVLARKAQVVLHRAELDLGLAKGQIADISGQLVFPKVKSADPSRRITAASAVPCRRGRRWRDRSCSSARLGLFTDVHSPARPIPAHPLLRHPAQTVVAEAPFKVLVCIPRQTPNHTLTQRSSTGRSTPSTAGAPDGSAHPRRTPPARPGHCAGSPDSSAAS